MSSAADAAAILRADNPRGHGGLQAKRAADSQHPIANLHAVGIPQLGYRQILVGIDLDHGNIRVFIQADDLGGVLVRIVAIQLHLNLRGLLDHVVVGQNVAALIDNDT